MSFPLSLDNFADGSNVGINQTGNQVLLSNSPPKSTFLNMLAHRSVKVFAGTMGQVATLLMAFTGFTGVGLSLA
jgi:hypothetical protein